MKNINSISMKKMILMLTFMLAFATHVGAKNKIRLIRNATLKMEYAGKQILVDPMLGAKASMASALGVNINPRVNLTMPVEEVLEELDFTLLTHNHPDHYDKAAVKMVRKDMPWFVQTEDIKQVKETDGFSCAVGVADSIEHEGITIIRVRSSHGRGQLAVQMGPSSGYILKARKQPTVYIMGDCIWNEKTRVAVSTYKPDYIVINTGGKIFIPQSKTDGDITMNEMEAMQMLKDCNPHIRFIAVHMDAVDHGQTSRAILRNQAEYEKVDKKRLMIQEDGEVIILK